MSKIIFVTNDLDFGGAQQFLLSLANKLNGNESAVTVFNYGAKEFLLPRLNKQVQYVSAPRKTKFDAETIEKFSSLIRREKFDNIFYTNLFSLHLFHGSVNKVSGKINESVVLHSTIPRTLFEYVTNLYFFHRYRKHVTYVATTEMQRNYLAGIYKFSGITEVIYNGVDTEKFCPKTELFDEQKFRLENGLATDSKIILQVAGFRPEKRHEDSLSAFEILKSRYNDTNIELVFVGDMNIDRMNTLANSIANSSINKSVHFFSADKVAAVLPFYWIADVFTLTSNTTETLSIAALEAMATGVPAVLTNIGGSGEIVNHGINGYLVEPENLNQIAQAWQDVLLGKLTSSKHEIVEYIRNKFSIEICTNNYKQKVFKNNAN